MAQNYTTYFSSNAYELNKKVTLLKRFTVVDESGGPKYVWHPIADVMAMLEPISGREFWFMQQSNIEATVRITIRYREGIEDSMRILYNAGDRVKVYAMQSMPIDARERHEYLQLMCNEVEAREGIL